MLFLTRATRLPKPGIAPREPSSEALSITRILLVVVVARRDSMHSRNDRPEFQLMIATVLVMSVFRVADHKRFHDNHQAEQARQIRQRGLGAKGLRSDRWLFSWRPSPVGRRV